MNFINKSIIVGITGGSGSGKTTFAQMLQNYFSHELCTILSQDHYYIDQSENFTTDGSINFDHPSALDFSLLAQHLNQLRNGMVCQIPRYDFVTHKRLSETQIMKPFPLIIIDGTMILSQPQIVDELHYSIFMNTTEKVRFERRLYRDTRERGRTPEGVIKQFQSQVKPMHDEFVEPTKHIANQILNGETDFKHHLDKVVDEIKIYLNDISLINSDENGDSK